MTLWDENVVIFTGAKKLFAVAISCLLCVSLLIEQMHLSQSQSQKLLIFCQNGIFLIS